MVRRSGAASRHTGTLGVHQGERAACLQVGRAAGTPQAYAPFNQSRTVRKVTGTTLPAIASAAASLLLTLSAFAAYHSSA